MSIHSLVFLQQLSKIIPYYYQLSSLPLYSYPKAVCHPAQVSKLYYFAQLGDNCIQMFHLGWYMVGYMAGNFVFRRHISGALKHYFGPYIRQYTTPNKKFKYCYPHSNVLLNYKHRKCILFC